jgi:hypothetical protein
MTLRRAHSGAVQSSLHCCRRQAQSNERERTQGRTTLILGARHVSRGGLLLLPVRGNRPSPAFSLARNASRHAAAPPRALDNSDCHCRGRHALHSTVQPLGQIL